ncbi:hypothetical protein HKD37_10G028592 [Glycine soja]
MKPMGYIESDHVQDDVHYQVEEMSHVNEVIEVESISGFQDLRDMSLDDADLPQPSSHDSCEKGTTAKQGRYVVRLLPPQDSLSSSTSSPSSVSVTVRPPDIAPTSSPPSTEVKPSSSHVNACGLSPVPASTPSPSSVDARGPSPVPTSSPSPSPIVANMLTDEDATNLAMDDPPLMILLWFHPSKVAAKAITLSIRKQFAAGPKRKGRLYGTGDLAHTYKCENDNFMQHTQGSSSRDEDASEINQLRVEVRQSKEEMCVFQSIILQFLPLEAKNIIYQQQQPHQQHDHVDDQQADDQHEHDDQQRHSPDDCFDY